jgi:hypothetical protein
MISLQSILWAGVALGATVSADCTRAFLQNATSQYVAAQSAGNPALLTVLATNASYIEREKPVSIKTGLLSQPMKIDRNSSIHDTTNCATFTELIVTNPAKPYVIVTRMLFTGNQITTIESIATHPGDWSFNATGYIYWESLENWDPIPAAKQDTRAVIQAAGDAYFNRFDNVNATVPWGTSCTRLEGGGSYTGANNLTGETCSLDLPATVVVTNRRYVVDETLGAVNIFLGFPGVDHLQGDTPMPSSYIFRINGGKIDYIHMVSSCVEAGCGWDGIPIP